MTVIKICGIAEVDHALAAAQAGADLIGLVFYPPSHRYLTPDRARAIVEATRAARPEAPGFVGVFVDEPAVTINRLAAEVGLDYAQISGDEPWSLCADLAVPVIKSLRIDPAAGLADLEARLAEGEDLIRAGRVRLLLDTQHPGYYGGTGRTFDWALAAELARNVPFLLAGGLTPENAAEAVRAVRPWGLDVSSGVETDKRKDPGKIRRFLAAARSHDGAVTRRPDDRPA
ncbi:MAG TPA: phosphoribosylanthranilate isomerase [Dehalococcoidia bacterium]|nr:phosphoribosylanthranilate isomerase [Dehalococcoidia bacterium]